MDIRSAFEQWKSKQTALPDPKESHIILTFVAALGGTNPNGDRLTNNAPRQSAYDYTGRISSQSLNYKVKSAAKEAGFEIYGGDNQMSGRRDEIWAEAMKKFPEPKKTKKGKGKAAEADEETEEGSADYDASWDRNVKDFCKQALVSKYFDLRLFGSLVTDPMNLPTNGVLRGQLFGTSVIPTQHETFLGMSANVTSQKTSAEGKRTNLVERQVLGGGRGGEDGYWPYVFEANYEGNKYVKADDLAFFLFFLSNMSQPQLFKHTNSATRGMREIGVVVIKSGGFDLSQTRRWLSIVPKDGADITHPIETDFIVRNQIPKSILGRTYGPFCPPMLDDDPCADALLSRKLRDSFKAP